MDVRGTACEQNDNVYLEPCGARNTYFKFVPAANGAVQIKVAGADLCMASAYDNEVRLLRCDSTSYSSKFQFFKAGLGSFNSSRFEISPYDGGCYSSLNYPDEGKYILKHNCNRTRAENASYWNKY
jgi:hypothetical protein